ncbi:hypothetical protein [Streptomyces sp. NPDC050164]|uniref:hypothetical protein n=1 Tax=Streptomyces sp. NPDC050164 TaxID=3365605 RepID=UPI00379F3ABE
MGAGDGTWEMILAAVLAAADADDDIDWTVSVDSMVVRAHQHAAGALKRGRPTPASPPITVLGRSGGGLSIKVHLAADGRARPLAFTVTAGQAGDAPAFETCHLIIRPAPRTNSYGKRWPCDCDQSGKTASRHGPLCGVGAVPPGQASPFP